MLVKNSFIYESIGIIEGMDVERRKRAMSQVPPFGSRLTDAMTYRSLDSRELTERLDAWGLKPARSYVHDLASITRPANPTLLTLAALRAALGISGEWWFDPTLTAADLPALDLWDKRESRQSAQP